MGRGRYVLFDPDYSSEKQSRRRLEADLSVALKEHQLELYYQPIRDVKTEEVKCCEALMRWHHPQLGWMKQRRAVGSLSAQRMIRAMSALGQKPTSAPTNDYVSSERVSGRLSGARR